MEDRYNPKEIESKIYNRWLENQCFESEDQSTKPPYAITLPPPNVTGSLHIGHALDFTIQDLMIRWKRMKGFNAMWMPGADHAGIATQSVVEKQLWKEEKKSRFDIGRDEFLNIAWKWKDDYMERIIEQNRALGFSLDWPRLRFTLDEKSNQAVRKVFVKLYQEGLIYRGTRLVNWSTKLRSAISDLEVDHQEQKGSLWHIRYPIADSDQSLIVATTRPETMLGDTAVAVHPDDERYKAFIGKEIELPLTDRRIPIIGDSYVEKDFGSGVVKITPAHDFNDYEVGKRHDLPMLNILNLDGTLNEESGEYQGLSVKEARKKVLEDLESQGFLEKEEPHQLKTPLCSRTQCVVEPMLSQQWFVKIESLATPAKRVVESGTLSFEPEAWTKTYLHWMNHISDWCISRQLWWGHQIPVWYCQDCGEMNVSEEDPTECDKCGSSDLKQDDDVLDTWFSSALWPFSTLGWPEKTEALKTFYPNDLLVTGPDIIFFWVARMVMMGLHFQKDVPFRKVYLHGIVRDSQGRKMSKSLGNGIDPLDVVKQEGADALRFTLLSQIATGKDIKFSTQRLEGYRNFMNKIWNATRFALGALEDFEVPPEGLQALPNKNEMSLADQWITQKLLETEELVEEAMTQYRFSDATQALYNFAWNQFCDWYLEFIKPIVYGEPSSERSATQLVLAQTLNRMLRLLSPMIPFITEELYSRIPIRTEMCMTSEYPSKKTDRKWLELASEDAARELDIVKDVITSIRNIRGENRIKQREKITCFLSPSEDSLQKILGANKDAILRMGGLSSCEILEEVDKQKSALAIVHVGDESIEVVVPLAGIVDFEEEIKRIQKSLGKIKKEILQLEGKLKNENFVKNAPQEIVDADKQNLEMRKAEMQSLQESLQRLS